MSLGSLWGAVQSAALVSSVSLMSILQAGHWFLLQLETTFQHILSPQIGIRILKMLRIIFVGLS